MRGIWAKGCAAIMLVAVSLPAAAAERTIARAEMTSQKAAKANPVEPSRFNLTARPAVLAVRLHRANDSVTASSAINAEFGSDEIEYIEGPSWSYQTARRGPVFEMGALGGGAMADAPFLAHVALAWQF